MRRLAFWTSLSALLLSALPACAQQDSLDSVMADCGGRIPPRMVDSCLERVRVLDETNPSPQLEALEAQLSGRAERDRRDEGGGPQGYGQNGPPPSYGSDNQGPPPAGYGTDDQGPPPGYDQDQGASPYEQAPPDEQNAPDEQGAPDESTGPDDQPPPDMSTGPGDDGGPPDMSNGPPSDGPPADEPPPPDDTSPHP